MPRRKDYNKPTRTEWVFMHPEKTDEQIAKLAGVFVSQIKIARKTYERWAAAGITSVEEFRKIQLSGSNAATKVLNQRTKQATAAPTPKPLPHDVGGVVSRVWLTGDQLIDAASRIGKGEKLEHIAEEYCIWPDRLRRQINHMRG